MLAFARVTSNTSHLNDSHLPPSIFSVAYYESLFLRAGPDANGEVSSSGVVMLLKTSGIPVSVLREIWTLSNMRGGSALNRPEFALALRAVAAAQAGATPSLELLMSPQAASLPLPIFEGIPLPTVAAAPSRPTASYAIGAADQTKYDAIFATTDTDKDGFISGGEAVALFLKSGLEKSILKSIWTLSDMDKDQKLDHSEFCVAMHLVVSLSKRGMALPVELPRELIPHSKAHLMGGGGD